MQQHLFFYRCCFVFFLGVAEKWDAENGIFECPEMRISGFSEFDSLRSAGSTSAIGTHEKPPYCLYCNHALTERCLPSISSPGRFCCVSVMQQDLSSNIFQSLVM